MAGSGSDRRYARLIGGAVIAVLLTVGFVWFVRVMMASKTAKPTRQVQIVQIIRPPPPPPDQPPPPPPEKTEVPLPKDQPNEPPPEDAPAPAQPLGIDAEGSAGSDAFGLAARSGGSDLISGNGSSLFAWYTNKVKDVITEKLSNDSQIALKCGKRYSISARTTIETDGRINPKLASTTGTPECDQRIEADLASMPRMSDPPPPEMPQPVTWKFVQH